MLYCTKTTIDLETRMGNLIQYLFLLTARQRRASSHIDWGTKVCRIALQQLKRLCPHYSRKSPFPFPLTRALQHWKQITVSAVVHWLHCPGSSEFTQEIKNTSVTWAKTGGDGQSHGAAAFNYHPIWAFV